MHTNDCLRQKTDQGIDILKALHTRQFIKSTHYYLNYYHDTYNQTSAPISALRARSECDGFINVVRRLLFS